jgi:hypothetical protein
MMNRVRRLNLILIFLLVTIPLYLVILWHNWSYVASDIVPYGDAAADMLLIERARHDWLLTGHYSRFGFHHPGPFFLYARYFAETLLGDAPPSPYGAQLTSVIAVNVFFIGLAATTAAALVGPFFGPNWKVAATVSAATVVVLLIQDNGVGMLAHPWMPFVLVAPFLAFVLLLAGTARGRLWMLPAASFCGGVLVHGYAPLVLFVGVSWPLALAAGVIQRRRSNPQVPAFPRGPLVASAAIIVLFVAPIILDMAINRPDNVATILTVAQAMPPVVGAPPAEIAAFVAGFWKSILPVLWMAAAAGVAFAWRDAGARAAIAHVIAVAGLMTLLAALYAWRAPGPLAPFIAQFYLGTPLAVVVIAVASAVTAGMRRAPRPVGFAVALAAVALAFGGAFTGPDQNTPGVRDLSTGVLDDLGGDASTGVRVGFETHEHWPFVTGLLLDLGRRGVPACAEAPQLAFLFTPERVCAPPFGRGYAMVAVASCAETCIVRSEQLGVGLTRAAGIPPYRPGQVLDFSAGHDTGRPYRAGGWWTSEPWGVWSIEPEALLVLPVGLATDGALRLRVQARSFIAGELSRQRVEVVVNGQPVAEWEFTTESPVGERAAVIPAEVAGAREPLRITFRVPDAASPASLGVSADARRLGIGLQWLRLDPIGSPLPG